VSFRVSMCPGTLWSCLPRFPWPSPLSVRSSLPATQHGCPSP